MYARFLQEESAAVQESAIARGTYARSRRQVAVRLVKLAKFPGNAVNGVGKTRSTTSKKIRLKDGM